MLKVSVGSIFRNSSRYLDRYFQQLEGLAVLLGRPWHNGGLAEPAKVVPVLVEGDSKDDTRARLTRKLRDYDESVLVKREHGKRVFGSVDDPERWAALAYCCNGVLENLPPDSDALLYVESDLAWEPETMVRLLRYVLSSLAPWPYQRLYDAVAPMCYTGPNGLRGPRGLFYDIWGHIKDGRNFTSAPPFHLALTHLAHERWQEEGLQSTLTNIDSAGSCIVAGRSVVQAILDGRVRFAEKDCIRGYCRSIHETGHWLMLDTGAEVRHL